MIKDITSLIIKNTVISRRHLTPELALRVIDETCPLWTASEDQLPFEDPFWAFYWPGGQAITRYILDNENIVKNRRVLDIGCGCGATSIAAKLKGANYVLANDIDKYAVTATKINADLNQQALDTSTENFIGKDCTDFDTIFIGDMFYDEEFAMSLFEWSLSLSKTGKKIIIGDPGRHGLTNRMRANFTPLATYDLPEHSCIENRGFTTATVGIIKLNITGQQDDTSRPKISSYST